MSEQLLEGLSYLKIYSDELQEQISKKDEKRFQELTFISPMGACAQEMMTEHNESSVLAAEELIRTEREKIKIAREKGMRELEVMQDKFAEDYALNAHLMKLLNEQNNCDHRAWLKLIEEYDKCAEESDLLKCDLHRCQNHEMVALETNSQLLIDGQEKLAKSLEKKMSDMESILEEVKHKERLLKFSIDREEYTRMLISSDVKNARAFITQYRNKESHELTIDKKALEKKEKLIENAKTLTSAAQNVSAICKSAIEKSS